MPDHHDDGFPDPGELPDDPFHDTEYLYGQPGERPFATPTSFDGHSPTAPRRPELLDDQTDSWWHDLACWADWMIVTFRVANRFPPCWAAHPALVEELMALWLHWQAVWLPGVDPTGPSEFLRELDWSLSRVERLWRTPCSTDQHRPQPVVVSTCVGTPELHPWWSNTNYPKGPDPTWP